MYEMYEKMESACKCHQENLCDICVQKMIRGLEFWESLEHYCGSTECDGSCGVLWCGCIDICRCSMYDLS